MARFDAGAVLLLLDPVVLATVCLVAQRAVVFVARDEILILAFTNQSSALVVLVAGFRVRALEILKRGLNFFHRTTEDHTEEFGV